MAESIDNRPATATWAFAEWWRTLALPRATAAKTALLTHYTLSATDGGTPPKHKVVGYLIARFVRNRGLDV